MTLIWLAIGLGCLGHGAQVVWVAPTPTQLSRAEKPVPRDSAHAFQIFWLDQYGWMGICLVVLVLICMGLGLFSAPQGVGGGTG